MEVNIKEARGKFSALINQVEEGAEIILTRRGREVARLVPPPHKTKRLPSLKEFRKSIKVSGKPLSEAVIEGRKEERY
ncbi:MAG: type II toxin-antitoxin system prevent-host-death family antitoxin [Deltaproteobacteria bacterium]|nr:type II toxin-antitoxin system prevent-host-death family antitoxin [Deltaproteobacteria bacterium]